MGHKRVCPAFALDLTKLRTHIHTLGGMKVLYAVVLLASALLFNKGVPPFLRVHTHLSSFMVGTLLSPNIQEMRGIVPSRLV